MRFLAGFVSAFLLMVIAGAIIVWTGAYNFAASEAHAGSVRSVIDTALQQSVQCRADELRAPANFTPAQLREGFQEFTEYCVHCHGAPGSKPHEWTTGMRPAPPDLSRASRDWTLEQTFWIVKHGIKMTGMPAFGDTESDRTIWNIAAFVKRLPNMTAQEYGQLRAQAGGSESGGHGDGHAHSH